MKTTYNSLSNEDFLLRLQKYDDSIPLEKYKGIHHYMRFKCKNNHIWKAQPNNIFHGQHCPYCSNKKILVGFNDVNTTHPNISKLFVNEYDKITNKATSNNKVEMKCPNCGNVSNKIIKNVYLRGFSCSYCSDGISYPNKFIRNLFKQLNVNADFEWNPDWLKPYYYDCHFIHDNKEYVVEMDGSLGHGNKNFDGSNNIINTDYLKDNLAKKKDIEIIRIDCNYSRLHNRFDHIVSNILNSKLSIIFDLSTINFEACGEFALSSFVVECAKLYVKGFSSLEIQNELKCCVSSVYNWLNQATEIGLCKYSKLEMIQRSRKNICKPVMQFSQDDTFIKLYYSIQEAQNKTGINRVSISNCCRNIKKTAGGFKWKYYDPNQPDKSKIIA